MASVKEVATTMLKHWGIGIGTGQAQEKPPAPVKAGIQPKKSNVVRHNQALKEAYDLTKVEKK